MRICITPGEPAGIGPDILLKSIQGELSCELVAIASPDMLQQRAKLLGLDLTLHEFNQDNLRTSGKGHLSIVPCQLRSKCQPGTPSTNNAEYVLQTLQHAHELCQHKITHAMLTGPVHKSVIAKAGFDFSGHTEYLADLCGIQDVLMCFYHPEMIVALATTHYRLNEVAQNITAKRLEACIQLLHHALRHDFKSSKPITVLGLNPHAGENGVLGDEEETIISPIIEHLQSEQHHIMGPVSADTAFTPTMREKVGAYLAMYHDQGLIPIKALYFNQVVNITLGLPYLRTSVDHGTACHLAGTGDANHQSFEHVLQQTQQLIALRQTV